MDGRDMILRLAHDCFGCVYGIRISHLKDRRTPCLTVDDQGRGFLDIDQCMRGAVLCADEPLPGPAEPFHAMD